MRVIDLLRLFWRIRCAPTWSTGLLLSRYMSPGRSVGCTRRTSASSILNLDTATTRTTPPLKYSHNASKPACNSHFSSHGTGAMRSGGGLATPWLFTCARSPKWRWQAAGCNTQRATPLKYARCTQSAFVETLPHGTSDKYAPDGIWNFTPAEFVGKARTFACLAKQGSCMHPWFQQVGKGLTNSGKVRKLLARHETTSPPLPPTGPIGLCGKTP